MILVVHRFNFQEVDVKKCCLLAVTGFMTLSLALSGQQPAGGPITASEKGLYLFMVGNVVHAAEKMPETNYDFKPTPEVRSFGQLVGHVADANYMFCSQALGVDNPVKGIEKSKTSKADLVAALKGAVEYCSKAFDGMTEAKASEMTKFARFDLARISLLSLNTAHTDEHYGNMVTYMRLKGIVPPTSESQPAPPKSAGQ